MTDTELKIIEDIREYQDIYAKNTGERFDYRESDDWMSFIKDLSLALTTFVTAEQMRLDENDEIHAELKQQLLNNFVELFDCNFLTLEQRKLVIDSLAIIKQL